MDGYPKTSWNREVRDQEETAEKFPLWDAPLAGEEDPSMEVPKVKTEEELPGHPPGIHSLREWGETVFPDCKHVRKTFRYAFENDPQYMSFMCKSTRLKTAWTKSFQAYALHRMELARRHNSNVHKKQLELYRQAKKQAEQSGDLLSTDPEKPGLSTEDWEVLLENQAVVGTSSSSKRTQMLETMDAEVSVESRNAALTKIAILQREIEKLQKQVEM